MTCYRLVSAFRDKLERCHSIKDDKCNLVKDFYYRKYGKAIVASFRSQYLAKFGKESLSEK